MTSKTGSDVNLINGERQGEVTPPTNMSFYDTLLVTISEYTTWCLSFIVLIFVGITVLYGIVFDSTGPYNILKIADKQKTS
jgi:hypothetical protein